MILIILNLFRDLSYMGVIDGIFETILRLHPDKQIQ